MFARKTIARIVSNLFVIPFILAGTPIQMDDAAAAMLYAEPDGGGDCSSWDDACSLQTALTDAVSGDEIWVAAGTYKPTTGTDRNATFQLKDGVAVYGGFAGTETAREQRNWTTNVTLLSGDIGVMGDTSDNSYHVVTGSGTDGTAVLDGFAIQAGNANGPYPHDRGAGMWNINGSPTLSNLIFSGNSVTYSGGGMFNENSSPVLTRVAFNGNTALTNGGGMDNISSSSPTLINVTFSGNTAYSEGGGMRNYSYSSPRLTNVTFSGNQAGTGGGMHNTLSNPTLTNVTISGNQADTDSGGIYNRDTSNPLLQNTIIWGNQSGSGNANLGNEAGSLPIIRYSLVEPCNPGGVWDSACGADGGNNRADADPLFVAPEPASSAPTMAGNYRLQDASPAINIGDTAADLDGPGPLTATIRSITEDLDGNPRFVRVFVDLGAYENQTFPCPADGVLFVDQDATGLQTGASWMNALMTLQDALQVSAACEIWVADGVYYPDEGGSQADNDRFATFLLKDGVTLYGGFTGKETARSQRNPAANLTILSGDLKGDDVGFTDNAENAYHVVTGADNATLDGFTITAGNANGTANTPAECGGGMYNGSSSPTLKNMTFSGNSASEGGGMCNFPGSPTLTNVTFSGNSAVIGSANGGGMINWGGDQTLINVTFSGNSAYTGGGMFNWDSNPTLTNVTFSGNLAWGSGMFNAYSNTTVRNSILWDDGDQIAGGADVSNSVVQGGCPAGSTCSNILVTDPKLGSLGYYGGVTQTIPLLPGSSAIDALVPGTNGCGTTILTDQRGVTRPQRGQCDIGAYEYDYTGIYHVKPVASGMGNCQSWDDACTLQNALTTAISGDVIWAAAGTYKPTTGTDRSATFQLKDGVAVYGGFAGTETARSQRNPATHVAILSGDLLGNDNSNVKYDEPTRADNSYHVVTGNYTDGTAELDSFTITAGNANDTINYDGGGMYNLSGSSTLTNITFRGNSVSGHGGGMYNEGSNPTLTNATFNNNSAPAGGGMYNHTSNITITDVTFSGNSAGAYGGGMQNTASNPMLTNVTFSNNSANSGGGMANFDNSNPKLTNTIFTGNSAVSDGGGVYNVTSNPTLTSVTFSGNSAVIGGGMINQYSIHPVLTNVTFSGNSAIHGGGMANRYSSNPQIRNTIFWGNSANVSEEQIFHDTSGASSLNDSVVQGGCPIGSTCTNIITTDPNFGTLGDYGGFTQTIPLLAHSSAIDAGNDAVCPSSDQRGVSRPRGEHCDIGAYEYIDTTAPTVDIFTLTTPSNSLAIPITTFSASDDVSVTGYMFTTSSAAPTAGSAGWSSTTPATYTVASDGSYTLYPWAKDATGNVSAAFGSPRTVVVDTTKPVVMAFTLTTPSNSLAIPITAFEATDANGVTGYLITTSATPPAPGTAGWTGSAPLTCPVASDGSYTLYPWAKDAAGNVSAVFTSPRTVVVDTTAPVVTSFTVTTPSNSRTILITAFSATDANGVTGYLITESSTPPAPGAAGWTGTPPTTYLVASDGSITLYPWARDAAGNVSAVFASPRTVVVDTTAPVVTIFTVTTPSNNLSIPITAFEATDANGVTGYLITESSTPPAPGAAGWTGTPPTTYPVLSDGSYSLYPWARDAVGNVSALYASPQMVSVDTIKPVVTAFTITTPSNRLNIPITVFSATDANGVTGYLITTSATAPTAGAAGWTGNAPLTYPVASDGSYTLYPWAKDAAGNVSAVFGSPRIVVVDTKAPDTQIDTHPTNPSNSADASFSFSSLDGTATFECSLDSSSLAPCNSPQIYTGLPAGSHTFTVRARDPAGNVDATPPSYTWVIDLGAPTVVSSVRSNPSPTYAHSVNFTVTFSEPVTGVDVSDFSLTTTGVSGAFVTSVSGSGSVYTVTINTGSGNGSIRLDILESASITDLAGNLLSSLPYTGGETYTVSRVFIFLPVITR